MQKGLIIGGGIAGLSAAIALQQAGIECRVYEAAPEIQAVGAGIIMASNAMQVFDKLGFANKIIEAGARVKQFAITDERLRPIQQTNQDWIREKYGFGITSIHRADLQRALIEELGASHLFLNKQFQSFTQSENKVVAHFNDGSEAEGDFLLGADGIHSVVRQQMFPGVAYRYAGQTCWRGITEIPIPEMLRTTSIEAWGNRRRFGAIAVNKEKVYWFAVLSSPPGGLDEPATLKNDLKKIFAPFHSLVIELLEATPLENIIRNDLYDFRPIPKWYDRRVCLIGDAAHATTPNMGQGGCQAVEDAWALKQVFQNAQTTEDAFEKFQTKRIQKTAKVVNQSFTFGKIAHMGFGRNLRNFFLRLIPESLGRKQLDWLLRIE